MSDTASPSGSGGRPLRAVVKYPYEAEDSNQLSLLRVGDVVIIHSRDSEDWWDGEFEGARGYLPAKYVELLSYSIPAYDVAHASSSSASGSAVDDPDAQWERHASSVLPTSASASSLMQNMRHQSSASLYLPSSSAIAGVGLSHGSSASSAPLLQSSQSESDFGQPFWSQAEEAHDSVLSGGGSSAHGYGQTPAFLGLGPSNNVFSLWSSSLAKLAGGAAILLGALTLLMGLYNESYFTLTYAYVGAYAMILGGLTLVYELFFGRPRRTPTRLPFRAFFYGLLMVPMLVAYPTRFCGLLYTLVAAINLISALRGESVTLRARREERQMQEVAASQVVSYSEMSAGSAPLPPAPSSILPRSFTAFFLQHSTPYRGRRWFLLLLYLCAVNIALIVLCWLVLVRDKGAGFERDGDGRPWNGWWLIGLIGQWCILLNLVPFFSTMMRCTSRMLYDAAVGANMPLTRTAWNRLASGILTFLVPDPHHAILFYHKVISATILVYSILHGLSHTLSFMVEPEDTLSTYTYWIYTSGALLMVCLTLIYSVSRREIREGSMVLFRWVHSLYIPFLVLLLFHAKDGYSWKAAMFIILPMLAWLGDKAVFMLRTRRNFFPVLSVAHIRPNALRLEVSTALAPVETWGAGGYEEGAFCYVCFPALSSSIWLPVTISSPPPSGSSKSASSSSSRAHEQWDDGGQELALQVGASFISNSAAAASSSSASSPVPTSSSITLHLAIDSASLQSFSARVQEYFSLIGPLGSSHYTLDDRRRTGSEVSRSGGYHQADSQGSGRLYDQEGNRLLLLDGPHPSVVSHVTRYHTCMLAATSSGLGALSSVLRSVVLQRWKSQLVGVGAGNNGLPSAANLGSSSSSIKGFITTPDVLFLAWILPWAEIDDHRWMCQTIKDVEDELHLMRESPHSEVFLRTKHLELHIFVTGVPSDPVSGAGHGLPPAATSDESYFGPGTNLHQGAALGTRSPFTTLQLYRALKNPTPGPAAQLSDVHVHRGAPVWGDLMTEMSHRAKGQSDVGCIYTAGPLSQRLAHASATYLHAAGLPAPSQVQIHGYHRAVAQLREQCAHHERQSGKVWRLHTDLDC